MGARLTVATLMAAVLVMLLCALRSQNEPRGRGVMISDAVEAASSPTLVGKQVCAECHRGNFDLHCQSGHAQTFARTRDWQPSNEFAGKTVDAGAPFGLYAYRLESDGLVAAKVKDQRALVSGNIEGVQKLPYALGSGRNAITLLALVKDPGMEGDPDGETVALEHHVSWFGSHESFGLTPGHISPRRDKAGYQNAGHENAAYGNTAQDANDPTSEQQLFGELVRGNKMQECIHCHTTAGQIVGQRIEGLVAGVNCERCHGPGSEHVRLARLSQTPPPYSVGRSDWDQESELQLCGSCHRLPRHVNERDLRDYSSEMLRLQPIGMLRSECYLKSDGRMTCTTCHNPHMDSSQKSSEDYAQDCRRCHLPDTSGHVACPVSPEQGCIDCHLPPITVEQGLVFHDHWIRIRDEP
ncbi:multiheme c-type cytochrome [Roseiconus nitratireducens]|nr:multiheme c-type cytochrome [Roseiconus nitratireducens]